jgi:RNA polymerase subunit RPABC4/transcription elongation factor Spt4
MLMDATTPYAAMGGTDHNLNIHISGQVNTVMASPPGAPQGGTWFRQKYYGNRSKAWAANTAPGCIHAGFSVLFCQPCPMYDDASVYRAPDGQMYTVAGALYERSFWYSGPLRECAQPDTPAAALAPAPALLAPAAQAMLRPPLRAAATPCHKCSKALPPDAKFCLECGEATPQQPPPCANCGQVLPAGAKFCLECGTKS